MSSDRNATCPCGSGLKYKKCCQEKDLQSTPDYRRRELCATRDQALNLVADFMVEAFPHEVMGMAVDEFEMGTERREGPGAIHAEFFSPFMLLHWQNRDWKKLDRRGIHVDVPLAMLLLTKHPERVNDRQRRYLEAASEAPYSFQEVIGARPGEGILVRDAFTQVEVFVSDVSASRSVVLGCLLFGQVVELDGTAIYGACSSLAIPAGERLPLIALRQQLKKDFGRVPTGPELVTADVLVRNQYWQLYERLVRPTPPQMCNTDGDPIEFHTLHFEITGIEEALEKLASITVTQSWAEILERGTRDKRGRLKEIEFAWGKKGNRKLAADDNTVLGSLKLKPRTLTVEVNSAKRASAIRKLIENLAGECILFASAEIKGLESMMKKRPRTGAKAAKERQQDEELNNRPEIRQRMAEFHRRHMESWIDEQIPALGGQTPRQAVKDPDGREMVEALLTQFESRQQRQDSINFDCELFEDIRRSLGLS